MEKINLYKEFKRGVHVPYNRHGQVYYSTYREDEYGNLIMKDSKVFNSPTNVRRVYFTVTGVFVEFYTETTNASGNSMLCNIEKVSSEFSKGIDEFINTGNLGLFEGDPFNSLINPWVTSNIEEVYFDASVLLSPEVRNRMSFLNPTVDMIRNCITCKVIKGCVENKVSMAIGLDRARLVSKFPRLKSVGFISNLSSLDSRVLTAGVNSVRVIVEKAKNGIDTSKQQSILIDTDEYKTFQSNKVYVEIIERISGTNSEYDEYEAFTLRDNYYKFDDIKLKPLVQEMTNQLHALKVKETIERVKGTKEEIDTELENMLEGILKEHGNRVGTQIIKTAAVMLTKEELESIFRSMSSTSEKKYRALISQ